MKALSRSLALLTVIACSSGGGDFGANVGINRDQEAKKDEDALDDENAPADEPTQVSGAFLSMAFMEGQNDAQARIKSDPEGRIEIAVCLRDKRTLQCVDNTGLDERWQIVTVEKQYLPLETQPAPATIGFHFILQVPIKHLAGTVLVHINHAASGKRALRARTLTSVGEFGAKYGPTVRGTMRAKQLGDPFDPQQEAMELGLAVPGVAETLGNTAPGIPTGESGAAPVDDGDNESGFWSYVLAKIGQVFGAIFSQPVTDITTEPVVPCSCGVGVEFKVAKPQPKDAGAAQPSSQAASAGSDSDGWIDPNAQSSGGSGGWTSGGIYRKPDSSSTVAQPTSTSTSSSSNTEPAASGPAPGPDPAPGQTPPSAPPAGADPAAGPTPDPTSPTAPSQTPPAPAPISASDPAPTPPSAPAP